MTMFSMMTTFLAAWIHSAMGQQRFYYYATSKNWNDANNYCISAHGTSLATITNDDDANEINGMISGSTWIGLNDISSEGTWVWASGYACPGGTCNADNFNYWGGGQPDNYNQNEHCAVFRTWGDLNDAGCGSSIPFICDGDNYGETPSPTGAPTTEPTSEPTRNCDLLDIDEFLTDCSVEWDNAGNVMSTMATSIETNAASITAGATAIENNAASIGSNAASIASNVASIQSNAESIGSNTESIAVGATSIASNTESIGKNTAAIASNAASIQSNAALENRIAALEHIMDQLDVNHAAAKYSPGNVDVVAPVSGMSDGINLTVKDIGILVLMAMIMVMIAIMVITCKRQSGRRKYQVVSVGSDIEPINA